MPDKDQFTVAQLLDLTAPIPRKFFEQPADLLAPALLGTVLIHGEKAGMLSETEAYLGLADQAAHAFRGLTKRTSVMFGPAGHAYVYLIYGMYECLNVVADKPGNPHCVLVRGLHPLAGLAGVKCDGPGKLTRAMGITRAHYGLDLCVPPLQLRQWKKPRHHDIEITPRIGIKHNVDWPLRFTISPNAAPLSARPRILKQPRS